MKHYEIKEGKYTFNVEEYSSAYELVEVSKARPVTPQWQGDCLEKDRIRKDFHGVKTREEAYELLRNGWTQEVEEMNAKLANARTNAMPKRAAFRNDVVGFAPVVPLAMMNVPQSMINTANKSVKSKVIKICYDMTDSWSTSTKDFLERGKKITEAVIALERNGYRCELYSMMTYCNGERVDTLMVNVKEARQPLDVKRVMFPFTHPAMFRVIGFEWQDRCPTALYMGGRGHGFKFESHSEETFKKAFGDEYVFLNADNVRKGKEEIEKILKGEKR